MRIVICAIALMAMLAAGAMAAGFSTPAHRLGFINPGGGFGRGYGPFHTYGWARGIAGYREGACYWHPTSCDVAGD